MITLTKLAVLQLLRYEFLANVELQWISLCALVFLLSVCYFIQCMTDTDDVALWELQVVVLLILHLRFCKKYICVFVAGFFALS